jgi:hypothetical protein
MHGIVIMKIRKTDYVETAKRETVCSVNLEILRK